MNSYWSAIAGRGRSAQVRATSSCYLLGGSGLSCPRALCCTGTVHAIELYLATAPSPAPSPGVEETLAVLPRLPELEIVELDGDGFPSNDDEENGERYGIG